MPHDILANRPDRIAVREADLVVVGAGLAGLSTAIAAATGDPDRTIVVLTKTDAFGSGSSWWAQGGIAAVWDQDDSIAAHVRDTLAAGDGLSDADLATLLATEGPAAVAELIDCGMDFDRTADGAIDLAREGGHSRRRILHAGGDATGRALTRFLLGHAGSMPAIAIERRAFARDVTIRDGRVAGLLVHQQGTGWIHYRTANVVLACGGSGQLFGRTTNPSEATADGIALALRAGASVRDLEFVQFHPTALDLDEAAGDAHGAHASGAPPAGRTPLLTEALRGEGAVLVDADGHRFMPTVHPLGDLAPRDVVARAVAERLRTGKRVYLDTRAALGAAIAERFPTVHTQCLEAGIDPVRDAIPIAPAAHYHMGGVITDADGRTDMPGLWACGEAACTGLHGANRMAGNSLLECLTVARRLARAVVTGPRRLPAPCDIFDAPRVPRAATEPVVAGLRTRLQRLMYDGAGVFRDQRGLTAAKDGLAKLAAQFQGLKQVPDAIPPARRASVRSCGELANMLLVARLLVEAALEHRGSRGAHYRIDYPAPAASRPQRRSLKAKNELAA